MNVAKLLKRIAFELTFFTALIILLPFHFVWGVLFLLIEMCKQYPPHIHFLVLQIFYGEKNS